MACQPGSTDTAKSKLTTVCTESTSGVERPASSRYAFSYRAQCRADPRQPIESTPKSFRSTGCFDLSRNVARSGMSPTDQKSSETVK